MKLPLLLRNTCLCNFCDGLKYGKEKIVDDVIKYMITGTVVG